MRNTEKKKKMLLTIILKINYNEQRLKVKIRILILLFVFINIGFLLFSQNIEENEPVRIVQDVDISQYIPFRDNSRVALLNRTASLRLHENLPILDGATALFPVYAAFVQAVYPEGDYSNLSRGIVRCSQTPRAFENLINGDVDIIFSAEPSVEHILQAAERGLEFNMTPIGIDAFVFFVNRNNPLENITTEQIRAIYSGELTNWLNINGIDEPIIAYQRPPNSGSQTILEQVIMVDMDVMEPIMENVVGGMGGIVERVSAYTNYLNAIGFSFLYFTTEMIKNDEIRLLSINGIVPARETIQTNEYEFTGTFYAITTGNETENTKRFIEWILSEEGQYLIDTIGYIPINKNN
jgi:phosphate transport system substrate-binding protein